MNIHMNAPTELLAQFLSTIIMKDYRNAATFCHLVQQFEPTNEIAKAFLPKLLEKLEVESESENEEEQIEVAAEENESPEESEESGSSDNDENDEEEDDQNEILDR